MKCPNCGREVTGIGRAVCTANTYQTSQNVTTTCCNKIITIVPFTSYKLVKYQGTETEDDWGVPEG